jgi:hypothetical protein
MFGLSYVKLIAIGVGALAVIGILAMVNGWRVERNHLRDWQTTVLAATRDAAVNPKLATKDVPAQIKLLGQAIADLKAGIAKQNAAVNALAVESDRQKAEASQAVLKALGRAQAAQATSARLMASARSGSAPAGSAAACKPSNALTEAWQ